MQQLFIALLLAVLVVADPIDLMLARSLGDDTDPTGYLMSEKYDGVRAFWDGEKLYTREKNIIVAPAWFTDKLPKMALDGELWLGRGKFEETVSIVLSKTPDERWQNIKYMVFDAPLVEGGFEERLRAIPSDLRVNQIYCKGRDHLKEFLKSVEKSGGEGVILRRSDSPYVSKRSGDFLKVKSFLDAEAMVIGYKEGKGKYSGMVGSLEVQSADGVKFFVGSGLTDAMRKDPPKIGTIITYKYRGVTANGVPRHATFFRIRSDINESIFKKGD